MLILQCSSISFSFDANLGYYADGLSCLGYLCLSKDADFPFKLHMEALDWSNCHISGICNPLSTTCSNGKTCLCWWWGTYRWWIWYDYRWSLWVCLPHVHSIFFLFYFIEFVCLLLLLVVVLSLSLSLFPYFILLD